MINIIIQLFVIIFVFIGVVWLTYRITEVWGLPKFLQYKPFNCWTCLTFWTLTFIYGSIWLMGYSITGIGGLILAVLNAIAMKVNQKNKTVKIEDLEDDNDK